MSSHRIVVVGGGILGTMHAVSAVERGFDVVQIEREADARGASLRNFGLVWVSGRAAGAELDLALKARARWEEVAERHPGTGFRANGSVTVARSDAELALMAAACAAPDGEARGFRLLDSSEVRSLNPAINGEIVGGLHCALDAGVEPRLAPSALRASLERSGHYRYVSGREIRDVRRGLAVDHLGDRYEADLIILCTGAAHTGLAGEVLSAAPLRRVRLQMFETAPFAQTLTTSIADGDSLRYYPAFDHPERSALDSQAPVASEHNMQLLCQQRLDGSLTVGDTHAYDEPFAFDLAEDPTDYLVKVLGEVLGATVPKIIRRWAGVYSQLALPEGLGPVYYRETIDEGVVVVTGPGGRGMTLSPAIAEETFE